MAEVSSLAALWGPSLLFALLGVAFLFIGVGVLTGWNPVPRPRRDRHLADVHAVHGDDSMVTQIGARLVLAVAIALTISCDRATKHLAATTLAGASGRSFLADTVRLEYVENAGGFSVWAPICRRRYARGSSPSGRGSHSSRPLPARLCSAGPDGRWSA